MNLARYTFGTELRDGAGIDAASRALEHDDLATTFGVHGYRDQADLEIVTEAHIE